MLSAALFVASFVVGARLSASEGALAPSDASSPTTHELVEALLSDGPAPLAPPSSGTTVVGYVETTTTAVDALVIESLPVNLAIDPVFATVATALADVSVPVHLPAEVPDSMAELEPTMGQIDPDGYEVTLNDSGGCGEAPECRVVTFTGRRSLAPLPPSALTGMEVPLPNGSVGWLADSACATECDSSLLTWREDDVRYSVGTRGASGRATLDLVWLALDSTVPSSSGPEACGSGAPSWDGRVGRTLTTALDDSREIHWVVLCSDAGTKTEIIDTPGTLKWLDLDSDSVKGPVIEHPDGSASVFSLVDEEPLPVIDLSRGGRLRIGELRCGDIEGDGGLDVFDAASGERLLFDGPRAVRRIEFNGTVDDERPCR